MARTPDLASLLRVDPAHLPSPTWLYQLIGDTEAAELLGVKPQTLRRWRVNGGGPVYCRVSSSSRGPVKFRRVDLLAFAAERLHTSTSAEQWDEPAVGALPRDER